MQANKHDRHFEYFPYILDFPPPQTSFSLFSVQNAKHCTKENPVQWWGSRVSAKKTVQSKWIVQKQRFGTRFSMGKSYEVFLALLGQRRPPRPKRIRWAVSI
jgi:hypothetical protein